ncbi:hypothetical protein GUJ93_ZPchr0015g6720 [Zizania palustris]|uniref:Uncharacterized protein n=1 Tax=Zizania palustris TaxID=103762 RepID=A0A8J5TGF3_ZIZPA|nr:hypothetical protein GUJ93_ZPchr0015g6720 [Zizania palustris]
MRIAATASPTAAGGARPGTAARGQAVAAVAPRPPVVMATATATDLLDWIVKLGWNSTSMREVVISIENLLHSIRTLGHV